MCSKLTTDIFCIVLNIIVCGIVSYIALDRAQTFNDTLCFFVGIPTHQLAWLLELGAVIILCLVLLVAYPLAVPVIVPLWIFRTCVYYAVWTVWYKYMSRPLAPNALVDTFGLDNSFTCESGGYIY